MEIIRLLLQKNNKMNSAFLLFGSNIGDAIINIENAIKHLNSREIDFVRKSSMYETEPWGFQAEQTFINQVSEVKTLKSAKDLLKTILDIESQMGRMRNGENYSSRIIDIDILYFNNEVINEEELQIPHPRLHLRNFTLVPLNEIAANYTHPVFNKTNTQLMGSCTDNMQVKKRQQ